MKLIHSCLVVFIAAAACAHAEADPVTAMSRGKGVYDKWCVPCHGNDKGHYGDRVPGTDALEAKYQGAVPALLEERRDLTPEFVSYIVRNGITLMPYYRKTEISDQDLEALNEYLTKGKVPNRE